MPLPMRRSGDWTPLVPKSTPSLPALVADAPSSVSDPAGEAELRRLRRGGGAWIVGCAAALLVGLAGSFAVVSALGAPRSAAAGGAPAVEVSPAAVAPPPPAATVPPVASVLEAPPANAAPPASAPKAAKPAPRGQ